MKFYILALQPESYFKLLHDWDYEGQLEQSYNKATTLFQNGIVFSEFGTRRRRDFKTHDIKLSMVFKARDSKFGTLLLGTKCASQKIMQLETYCAPLLMNGSWV